VKKDEKLQLLLRVGEFDRGVVYKINTSNFALSGTLSVFTSFQAEPFLVRATLNTAHKIKVISNETAVPYLEKEKKQEKRRYPRFTVRMLAVQSGRDCFNLYSNKTACPSNAEEIDRERLISMLIRENELRLSQKYLEQLEREAVYGYENFQTNTYHAPWTSVAIDTIQKQVVNEFGYINEQNSLYALNVLRSALQLFPNDSTILQSANYLKFNRCSEGDLNVGDNYIDVGLLKLNGEQIQFSNIMDANKPNIILCASVS
jgi:hypothetical protein